MYDFIRLSCAVPDISVGDVAGNLSRIKEKYDELSEAGSDAVVFTELGITGYTCGDLFTQKMLIDAAAKAVSDFAAYTSGGKTLVCIGAPLCVNGRLFDCAVVICGGRILGIVPKTYLPNYGEFYEKRWFSSAPNAQPSIISLRDAGIPSDKETLFGQHVIFLHRGVKFGVEICEDVWCPITPSEKLCLAGAEVILNPSASNEIIGKREYRRKMLSVLSSKAVCAYCYASSGNGESTTDLVFSGHSLVFSRGKLMAENKNYIDGSYFVTADVDIGAIRADRTKIKSFNDCSDVNLISVMYSDTGVSGESECDASLARIKRYPFVPSDSEIRAERCREIFEMQTAALVKRMSAAGNNLVVGVSGGLDSTLTLLVCANALRKCGLSPSHLTAVTMPGFGTTDRTYGNAVALIHSIGAVEKCVPIKSACIQHFTDIGHDIGNHNVVYENAQARERTQILMDVANQNGGFVVGTGDLSELALGWCTYNADHMSMYGVNSGVPKTLVRWMVKNIAESGMFPGSEDILYDILDTPISPELLPPDGSGVIAQKTEELVGPYDLNDFFIYNAIRFGFLPSKVYFLANRAFDGVYGKEEILKWLKIFYRRFFTQQFKRSCMPDGVKIGSVGLSPRGDWRMPSDASFRLWLSDLENL